MFFKKKHKKRIQKNTTKKSRYGLELKVDYVESETGAKKKT